MCSVLELQEKLEARLLKNPSPGSEEHQAHHVLQCHATTRSTSKYQPYQSIRHSVEAMGGKSISDAVNLGRTSLEMMDSIHVQLILLLRHHEDIMMRLEELKREKIANEDMEVFPDGKRTQILHIQIEGFTKLKT